MASVADRYGELVEAGELKPDRDQEKAVESLDRLAAELAQARRPGLLAGLFGKAEPRPRGIYLWGGVGRGKSMLMDLAFESIAVRPKRRVHFHEFMLEVHGRLRQERTKEAGDPIPPVAAAIAEEARLLAFDEMVINNSATSIWEASTASCSCRSSTSSRARWTSCPSTARPIIGWSDWAGCRPGTSRTAQPRPRR